MENEEITAYVTKYALTYGVYKDRGTVNNKISHPRSPTYLPVLVCTGKIGIEIVVMPFLERKK